MPDYLMTDQDPGPGWEPCGPHAPCAFQVAGAARYGGTRLSTLYRRIEVPDQAKSIISSHPDPVLQAMQILSLVISDVDLLKRRVARLEAQQNSPDLQPGLDSDAVTAQADS